MNRDVTLSFDEDTISKIEGAGINYAIEDYGVDENGDPKRQYTIAQVIKMIVDVKLESLEV